MKQKLFVLSMDAMVREDIAYLETKPNFAKIMAKRAEVTGVRSVYPASTYPAHTTLQTGCYPGKHGVRMNFQLKTVDDKIPHWARFSSDIEVETIFDAAKRAGCTTASVYWPITGNNPNIDYIINEYFFYYPGERDRIEEVFAGMGANEDALQAVRENLYLFPGRRNPKAPGGLNREGVFDDFIMGCTCSLIRNVQPDVMLVHNCWLDSLRHRYGAFNEHVTGGLDATDAWLGDVIVAMEEAGVWEQTNFVILSDHGQRNYTRLVKLNVLLQQGGLQELAPNGTIYNWKAYSQSNGKSTTIFLADNTSEKLYQRVYDYLKQLQAEGKWGIEAIHTREELKERYNQYGPFSFMVEADEETEFDNALSGDAVKDLPDCEVHGAHGYEPEKGPQPVFMGSGPAFREGAVLERAEMVDIAPTLAAVLGQTMPEADGRCLSELLR